MISSIAVNTEQCRVGQRHRRVRPAARQAPPPVQNTWHAGPGPRGWRRPGRHRAIRPVRPFAAPKGNAPGMPGRSERHGKRGQRADDQHARVTAKEQQARQ